MEAVERRAYWAVSSDWLESVGFFYCSFSLFPSLSFLCFLSLFFIYFSFLAFYILFCFFFYFLCISLFFFSLFPFLHGYCHNKISLSMNGFFV